MKEIKEMSEEKRAQFAQKFMANAQRGQAVQRGNNANILPNYIPYRPYAPVQQMPGYQAFPMMGYSPFAAGFNPSTFGMMPRVGYAPTYAPIVNPPVMYQQPQKVIMSNQVGQMGYPQQMNPNNQQRAMIQQPMVQPMMQPYQNNMPMAQRNQYPQPPMNQANPMSIISQGVAMNPMNQVNPVSQMNQVPVNFGMNMNVNRNPSMMGLNGSQANRMNNKGWWA